MGRGPGVTCIGSRCVSGKESQDEEGLDLIQGLLAADPSSSPDRQYLNYSALYVNLFWGRRHLYLYLSWNVHKSGQTDCKCSDLKQCDTFTKNCLLTVGRKMLEDDNSSKNNNNQKNDYNKYALFMCYSIWCSIT